MGDVCRAWATLKAYSWAEACSCLLLSSLGRNLTGVWYTLGDEDGGLKTSVGDESFAVYEGASGSASSFRCRRVVDSKRHCLRGSSEGACRWNGQARSNDLHVDIVGSSVHIHTMGQWSCLLMRPSRGSKPNFFSCSAPTWPMLHHTTLPNSIATSNQHHD